MIWAAFEYLPGPHTNMQAECRGAQLATTAPLAELAAEHGATLEPALGIEQKGYLHLGRRMYIIYQLLQGAATADVEECVCLLQRGWRADACQTRGLVTKTTFRMCWFELAWHLGPLSRIHGKLRRARSTRFKPITRSPRAPTSHIPQRT